MDIYLQTSFRKRKRQKVLFSNWIIRLWKREFKIKFLIYLISTSTMFYIFKKQKFTKQTPQELQYLYSRYQKSHNALVSSLIIPRNQYLIHYFPMAIKWLAWCKRITVIRKVNFTFHWPDLNSVIHTTACNAMHVRRMEILEWNHQNNIRCLNSYQM